MSNLETNPPFGLEDEPKEVQPRRESDPSEIDITVLKTMKVVVKKLNIDSDEIDPERAFGSDQEELMEKLERAASDRLPVPKPLPVPKHPPSFTPTQKPIQKRPTTRALKRRQLVDRLSNQEPSTAKKMLDVILRGLKKINPLS